MEATLVRNEQTEQRLSLYLYGDCNTDCYILLSDSPNDVTFPLFLYLEQRYELQEGKTVIFPRMLLQPLLPSTSFLDTSPCTPIRIFAAESGERLCNIGYLLWSSEYTYG